MGDGEKKQNSGLKESFKQVIGCRPMLTWARGRRGQKKEAEGRRRGRKGGGSQGDHFLKKPVRPAISQRRAPEDYRSRNTGEIQRTKKKKNAYSQRTG